MYTLQTITRVLYIHRPACHRRHRRKRPIAEHLPLQEHKSKLGAPCTSPLYSLLGRRRVGSVIPCNLRDLNPAVEAAVATAGSALESTTGALLPFSDELPASIDGVASSARRKVPTALPVAHAAAREPHDRLTPSHDQQPLHRQLPPSFQPGFAFSTR